MSQGKVKGILAEFKNPAEFLETNYVAKIDEELCTGCEECMAVCQMEALIALNGHTAVETGRCIGCGACIKTCPTAAIQLIQKEKQAIPPKDNKEMYRKMRMERYGVIGTLKLMGKALLGQKI